MASIKTTKIHISELKAGDTVIVDGNMQTVSPHHITKSELFGHQYKGYCHRETQGMLDVALFPKFFRGEFVGHVRHP
ncbi:hypothetical protein [Agrobacterium radiobacter]|uniref:hypothetical protein n=1 Tax=Agrobacterium radiobacter TaxID=362 RepID=UPI003CF9F853